MKVSSSASLIQIRTTLLPSINVSTWIQQSCSNASILRLVCHRSANNHHQQLRFLLKTGSATLIRMYRHPRLITANIRNSTRPTVLPNIIKTNLRLHWLRMKYLLLLRQATKIFYTHCALALVALNQRHRLYRPYNTRQWRCTCIQLCRMLRHENESNLTFRLTITIKQVLSHIITRPVSLIASVMFAIVITSRNRCRWKIEF